MDLELEERTQAFEMKCYRKLFNILYKDHATNEEVRRKIRAAIGEYDELITVVKKRKLRWFGHVSRSSGLVKTILQGTVKGKRRRVDRMGGGMTITKSGQGWTLPAKLGQLIKRKRGCCEVICGARTTRQGYGID